MEEEEDSAHNKVVFLLPLWIRLLVIAHRAVVFVVVSIASYAPILAVVAYVNREKASRWVDERLTEGVKRVLKTAVFPESEDVHVKRVKIRWNRLDVFDVTVGNCKEEDDSKTSNDDATTKTGGGGNKGGGGFSSPHFIHIDRISFKCSFVTLIPIMQFLPDKNFAVGFLSAKIDLMEARGVDVCIEEWRGKGNFRVFKKKEKNVTTALPSEANDTATTTDAALTKGRRETTSSGNEENGTAVGDERDTDGGDLFSYFQSQIQTQIEDANKKIQDAANKTLEISDSMVKEIGSVATDVTDKLTALGRYATMINTMQEDPIEMMQKRPLVLRVKETKLIDWNVKILTVSETSFQVKQFEMDGEFVGTGKAFGKRIAQGVLQRIIVEFQDESLNLITNGVSDGFMKSKKFLDDGFTMVYDGVKKTTESGTKMAAKTMENARFSFSTRTGMTTNNVKGGDGEEIDPHELTPSGSATSSHLSDDENKSESNNKDSVEYELFPDKKNESAAEDPHEMTSQQQKSAASASDLFGLGNLFSTCSPGRTTNRRKKTPPPPPPPPPRPPPAKSTTLGKPGSPPQP